MNHKDEEFDFGFTKERFPECHHLCLIYDDDEQRRKIVTEYLAAGIRQGNLVRYFSDTTLPDEIRAWLSGSRIDLQKVEQEGSFGIINAQNAYCPSGQFLPKETVDRAVTRYSAAGQAGYHGSWVSGEMSWVLRGIPGSENLLEYEVRLNMITDPFPHIGMCQYDARCFDGATLFKILQVHPFMIAQGKVVQNPFYLKPEEFFKKA